MQKKKFRVKLFFGKIYFTKLFLSNFFLSEISLQKSFKAKICLSKKNFDHKFFLQCFGQSIIFKNSFLAICLFFAKYLFFFQKVLWQNFAFWQTFWGQFYFLAKFLLGKISFDNFYKSDGDSCVGICSRLSQEPTFKVWSKSGEIFLIWTNVARTNFARTNVAMTVGISSRLSQESTFKVWSKSGQ